MCFPRIIPLLYGREYGGRKRKKKDGRMKEWSKRKVMWKRCRKELNLFDFRFSMLPNYV